MIVTGHPALQNVQEVLPPVEHLALLLRERSVLHALGVQLVGEVRVLVLRNSAHDHPLQRRSEVLAEGVHVRLVVCGIKLQKPQLIS